MVRAERDKRFGSANRPVCRTDLGITCPARRVGAEPFGDEPWKLEIATVTSFSYRTQTGSTIRVFNRESKADLAGLAQNTHIYDENRFSTVGEGSVPGKLLDHEK